MHIGVFTTIFQKSSFEEMLERAAASGVSAIEVGSGGLVGHPHCPVDELLASQARREEYLAAVEAAGLFISALSCHGNPIHPNREDASSYDEDIRRSVRLAQLLDLLYVMDAV